MEHHDGGGLAVTPRRYGEMRRWNLVFRRRRDDHRLQSRRSETRTPWLGCNLQVSGVGSCRQQSQAVGVGCGLGLLNHHGRLSGARLSMCLGMTATVLPSGFGSSCRPRSRQHGWGTLSSAPAAWSWGTSPTSWPCWWGRRLAWSGSSQRRIARTLLRTAPVFRPPALLKPTAERHVPGRQKDWPPISTTLAAKGTKHAQTGSKACRVRLVLPIRRE